MVQSQNSSSLALKKNAIASSLLFTSFPKRFPSTLLLYRSDKSSVDNVKLVAICRLSCLLGSCSQSEGSAFRRSTSCSDTWHAKTIGESSARWRREACTSLFQAMRGVTSERHEAIVIQGRASMLFLSAIRTVASVRPCTVSSLTHAPEHPFDAS